MSDRVSDKHNRELVGEEAGEGTDSSCSLSSCGKTEKHTRVLARGPVFGLLLDKQGAVCAQHNKVGSPASGQGGEDAAREGRGWASWCGPPVTESTGSCWGVCDGAPGERERDICNGEGVQGTGLVRNSKEDVYPLSVIWKVPGGANASPDHVVDEDSLLHGDVGVGRTTTRAADGTGAADVERREGVHGVRT